MKPICLLRALPPAPKRISSKTAAIIINQPQRLCALFGVDNGEGLSEGPVICQYVADLAPRKTDSRLRHLWRYRVQEWQNFIGTELHKTLAHCLTLLFPMPPKPSISSALNSVWPMWMSPWQVKLFNRGRFYRSRCLFICSEHLGGFYEDRYQPLAQTLRPLWRASRLVPWWQNR